MRQLTQRMEEPPAKPPPVTEKDIDQMGKTDLRSVARKWSVKQKNRTNEQLREDLKKHLRKQP